MFEELCTIQISGRCFPQRTNLDVFARKSGNKARSRISLIFGRNGSGKTTLSEALRERSLGNRLEGISDLQLLDANGNQITNINEAFSQVRVFNEAFVDEKVRVESNGLNSIVMLGDTGDIKDEINEKTVQREQVKSKRKTIETQVAKCENLTDELCPEYWETRLLDTLKGNAHWAFRKSQINGYQRNAPVDKSVLTRIIELPKPDLDLSTLAAEFQTKLADYQSIDSGSAEKLPDCPVVPSWMNFINEEKIIALLHKPVEKPMLTEREQRILSIIQNKGLSFVKIAQDDLATNQPDLCPYCLKPITNQEIKDIRKETSAILADEVKEHIAELEGALPENRQELQLEAYADSLHREVKLCQSIYNKCLSIIAQYETLLKQKKSNPFTSISSATLGFHTALDELSECLANLERKIIDWNGKIDRADKRKKELHSLSDKMARLEIDQLLITYEKSAKNKEIYLADLEQTKELETKLNKELSSLNAKLNNTYIALTKLNTMLAIIFGNRERLKLEPIEDNEKAYQLISRGMHVKPENVSLGERNAIALCYFFAQIGEGKAKGKEYEEETLLVIDDPVSSFDFENKIGIISLIKRFLRKTLQGNSKSHAILMTHDYLTMKSLVSACKDINDELMNHKNQTPQELKDFSLVKWNDSESTYDTLLIKAYRHALNPSDRTREGLGNAARRMMEAFSTFEYRCSFDKLALQGERTRIRDPFLSDYFHDFQFKLVMHQESHLKDLVKNEGSIETPDSFSNEGIDRSIREALCLIYLLNKEHVLAHLSDRTAEEHFERWIKEIKDLDSDNRNDVKARQHTRSRIRT